MSNEEDDGEMEIDSAEEWIRTRPKSVQDLLLRFPPCCIVRIIPSSDAHYSIPFRGTYGMVTSYYENGHLGVTQIGEGTDERAVMAKLMDASMGATGQVCAEVMEVVRYQGPYTVEYVHKAIYGQAGAA